MILKHGKILVPDGTRSHLGEHVISMDARVAGVFPSEKGKVRSDFGTAGIPAGRVWNDAGWLRAAGVFARRIFERWALRREDRAEGTEFFAAARHKPFWRVWIRRYALAFVITAGLHAALFMIPAGTSSRGGGAGEKSAAADNRAFILIEAAGMDAHASVQSQGASAAGGESAEVLSADEVAAVAAEMIAGELAVLKSDSFAWMSADGRMSLADAGGGFDILGGMRLAAGSGIGSGFGEGGFSFGRMNGAGIAGGGGRMVSATFMPEPAYPETARRERREGVVELAVDINAFGRASAVEVAKSSGHEDLDAMARTTVLRQWRFVRNAPDDARHCVVIITFNLRKG